MMYFAAKMLYEEHRQCNEAHQVDLVRAVQNALQQLVGFNLAHVREKLAQASSHQGAAHVQDRGRQKSETMKKSSFDWIDRLLPCLLLIHWLDRRRLLVMVVMTLVFSSRALKELIQCQSPRAQARWKLTLAFFVLQHVAPVRLLKPLLLRCQSRYLLGGRTRLHRIT